MQPERISYLTGRFFADACTAEEMEELARWVSQAGDDEPLKAVLEEAWQKHQPTLEMPEDMSGRILTRVFEQGDESTRVETGKLRRMSWRSGIRRIAVAVAIVIAVGAGTYFLFFNNKAVKPVETVKTTLPKDVAAPATNRAMITLASGQRVYLDSAANGTLAMQGTVQIKKLDDGQIAYTGSGTEVTYNTLFNPRGSRVITLTLSDGTQVWLNAESSVRYPTAFAGGERKVEITGEAYFEVAHDASKPFIVSKNNTAVTVLGTHFNVNAYDNEPAMKITLVEGSVRVEAGGGKKEALILKPGQQAICTNAIALNTTPNIRQVMAWKNGAFDFARQDFAASMRQLERWYDIKVVYDGAVPKGHLGGSIDRNLTLMQVVKVLDGVVATFRFENNTLHILP